MLLVFLCFCFYSYAMIRLRRYKRTNDFKKSHFEALTYFSELRNTVVKMKTLAQSKYWRVRLAVRLKSEFFLKYEFYLHSEISRQHSIIKNRPHEPLWVLSMQTAKKCLRSALNLTELTGHKLSRIRNFNSFSIFPSSSRRRQRPGKREFLKMPISFFVYCLSHCVDSAIWNQNCSVIVVVLC